MQRKIFTLAAVVGLIILAGWIWYERARADRQELILMGDDPRDHESTAQRLARFQSEAPTIVAQECTNEIPGIRQIVQLEVSDYDAVYTKWTATATVDYFNSTGGIERTNLYFGFSSAVGDLTCHWSYLGAAP